MSIGIGLTQIRKYNFAQNGLFYSGILSYVSGIERLLKIILIYDYRLNNDDNFPSNNYLKDLGHKISDLLTTSREINTRNSLSVVDSFFDQDFIYPNLISFLSDFAIQARYYNLDYLTGKQQAGLEPLTRWESEVCSEIIKRHYKPRSKNTETINELSGLMADNSIVHHTREDGSEINNVFDLMTHSDQIPVKQKYSMFYLYVIARYLSNICRELECKGNFSPFLSESFDLFRVSNNSYVLNKKTWNPN